MSNNPFLKNKDNNRFNFLNDEQPLKNANNKHYDDNRNRNRNSYNNNNYNKYDNKKIDNNRFKSISSTEQPKMNVDIDNIISFPSLVNTKECETTNNTSSKFKDILNTNIEEDIIENKNIIPPGWLQLTMLNGKILKNEYKNVNEKDIEEQEQEQINYNMYKIGNALQKKYELYEKEYDSINGEGSYDYNFRLSPIYGSEYDSNSESEEYDEDSDDYEYEN